jgi:hypothetical protein
MASRKQILKYTGIGLLSLLVLLLILLPTLIKNYVINNSKELVGRQMDMDKLRINYFTGTIKVYDFKLFEANDNDVFVSFDTLIVNTVPYKYISNVKALDQFYLQGLDVKIAKRDSTYNFDDLVAFHTAEDSTEVEPEQEEEVFKYLLENLELKEAAFHFYDADVDHTTEIEDFSLFIPFIAWDQEQDSEADVEFNLGESTRVRAVSNVQPGTGDFKSTIEVDNLQLSSFYEYALEYANINRLDGTVNATIQLTGNVDNPMETLVSGEAEAINPLMTDQRDVTFLSGERVLCTLGEINYGKNSYVIDDLVFEQPYVKFELDSVSNNLLRIFKYDTDTTDTDTADEEPLYYALNHVQVNQGRMDYTDNLTGQPFDYALSEIEIDTDSIFSDSEWVDVLSTMVLNDRGTLKAEIGYNPLDPMFATIDIAIEDFVLSDLNIYSSYYTGHSILTGDMFYFCDTKITDGQLDSENHLLIKKVDVENIKGGLYAVPLKIAVWLLKDKNGDIELDIPVRGDMDDPEVDTWALVGNTLKKKIFDTTDNPVLPLARFIDADPDDLKSIAIQFPDTSLTEDQTRQLDLILQLEREKEGLSVEMNFIGEDSLQTKLATAYAGELYGKKAKKDPAADPDGFQAFVQEQVGSDSLDVEGSLRQYSASIGADSLAVEYINTMISKVDSYLKTQQPDTRIVVQQAKVSDKDNLDASPQFKMQYSLKEDDDQAPAASTPEAVSEK